VFQIMAIPVYSLLANRVDLRWLMMFGLACFGVSMWCFSPITHDWGASQLLLPQALRGFGQQFAVAPTVTLTLGGIPQARLKLASGLFNLMRNLGGAIGIAVCATMLNDRTNQHFLHLAEHLNPGNEAMNELLAGIGSQISTWGGDAATAQGGALKELWNLALREAQTQTFSDIFLAIMVAFAFTTAMVPLLRKAAAGPASPNAH
jgi:DHA2 family multidrug resistance protein